MENPEFQALPLERSRQNHFLLRAEINGKAALLGVDTGAPVSAISAARRKHFGLSAIPVVGVIPGVIYYRLTLVSGLRGYVPAVAAATPF